MTGVEAPSTLWLCGPPGVGKSVVGWEVYSRLVSSGHPCAYVDIDQLGICFPARAADPDRHVLKADNLAALAAGFVDFGARGLVVSGVVDAVRGPDLDEAFTAGLSVWRLRAEPGELRRRLALRRASPAMIEGAVVEAQKLEGTGFADVVLDTTGSSVDEIATTVMAELGEWPRAVRRPFIDPTDPPAAVGPVLWLWGPTGVGKSTIGFRAYLDLLSAGVPAAYVDVDQIGFCSTAPLDHRLRARNLAAVWSRFMAAGARALVAVGPVASPADATCYTEALPPARITWCGLAAGEEALTRRILSRQAGGSWPQPGDPLRGRSTAELRKVAAAASSEAVDGPGVVIETDHLSVADAAAAVLARWDRGRPPRRPTGRPAR
ncbi:MAG TPA: AAA family ATPase [Acidimicrobiales bacterium]|nr:AAA family ATPase [Acidimicrobiales bacterium]